MPEGDTVWQTCDRLHRSLAGSVLTRSEFRVPALATVDLAGVEVREVRARGKHQLLRFDNGLTLHTHLRMDGSWRIYRRGRRWTGGPGHQIRVVLGTGDLAAVGYRLPVVELIRTDQEHSRVGHLGPDLLGADWDTATAVANLRAQPDRTIGEALLDQRNLAGIGTVYRAEILYLQGIHPRTPAGDVTDLAALCERVRELMIKNRTGYDQNTTGDRRPGNGHWVYGRARRPCRRCQTMIETEEYGPVGQQRLSYWCPFCQPLRRVPRHRGSDGSAGHRDPDDAVDHLDREDRQ